MVWFIQLTVVVIVLTVKSHKLNACVLLGQSIVVMASRACVVRVKAAGVKLSPRFKVYV